jgi:hypothetical protein
MCSWKQNGVHKKVVANHLEAGFVMTQIIIPTLWARDQAPNYPSNGVALLEHLLKKERS